MAVSYVGDDESLLNTSGTCDVPVPAGAQVGDLVFVFAQANKFGSGMTISVAGCTSLGTVEAEVAPGSGSYVAWGLSVREIDGTETPSTMAATRSTASGNWRPRSFLFTGDGPLAYDPAVTAVAVPNAASYQPADIVHASSVVMAIGFVGKASDSGFGSVSPPWYGTTHTEGSIDSTIGVVYRPLTALNPVVFPTLVSAGTPVWGSFTLGLTDNTSPQQAIVI